jgi:hypothetical protein
MDATNIQALALYIIGGKMSTADGGRRTADGGRRTADGGEGWTVDGRRWRIVVRLCHPEGVKRSRDPLRGYRTPVE